MINWWSLVDRVLTIVRAERVEIGFEHEEMSQYNEQTNKKKTENHVESFRQIIVSSFFSYTKMNLMLLCEQKFMCFSFPFSIQVLAEREIAALFFSSRRKNIAIFADLRLSSVCLCAGKHWNYF